MTTRGEVVVATPELQVVQPPPHVESVCIGNESAMSC
jgi:hypothetical protein